MIAAGWRGWDDYAEFYDWENARTLGRRDIAFWQSIARRQRGNWLELGCGTGRLLLPVARVRSGVFGIDRSMPMLDRAFRRARRLTGDRRPTLVRGDIRGLPFRAASFGTVIAPYGMLQSLLDDRDLQRTLRDVARVLRPGGLFGIDLVPDLPSWDEYGSRRRLSGRSADGAHLTLIESVRQDRRRHLTTFHEQFVERRGRAIRRRHFSLTFRTLPIGRMIATIERAGFEVESMLGDYRGRPWDPRADAWIILAQRP